MLNLNWLVSVRSVLSAFVLFAFAAAASAVNIAPLSTPVGSSSAVNNINVLNDGTILPDIFTNASFIVPTSGKQGVGYDLGGFRTVDSVRIVQHSAVGGGGARRRFETVDVYTTAGKQTFSGLADVDDISVNLGGVNTSYVFVVPTNQHVGAPDPQIGIREIEVEGSSSITPRTNYALSSMGTTVTEVGGGWNAGAAANINDGVIRWGPGSTDTSTSRYNSAIAGASLEFDFGQQRLIGTLGVLQQTFGGGGDRRMVQDIELEFSNDNFLNILDTQNVTLLDGVIYQQAGFTPIVAQYVRFNPLNQYGGVDANIGFTEIQFFAAQPAPEPSTFMLVSIALVSLGISRRRRRV